MRRMVHDVSLAGWALLMVWRALRREPAGVAEMLVVAVNLVAGTPDALARLRRRDPVALLAPPAVGAAVLSTAARSGTWWPVAATAVLLAVAAAERLREL